MESIKELENELKEAQYDYYRIVAELLTDVKTNLSYFVQFAALPHMVLIHTKIVAIETELQRQVQWSCREIGQIMSGDPNDPEAAAPHSNIDTQELSQMYLIIDVLGIPFRKDLLDRFAQLQLIPYEKCFKRGTKFYNLEHSEKRFIWFRRLLMITSEKLSTVFPEHWNVGYHLFCEFSRRSKKHFEDGLEDLQKAKLEPNAHVGLLLKTLKSVVVFESDIKIQLHMVDRIYDDDGNLNEAEFLSPLSINESFDMYLGPYVHLERTNLERLMESLLKDEQSVANDETSILATGKQSFGSSQKMFEFIKNSLKRCTQYSTGKTYLALSKEFRICLHHYSESMRFRCPSPKRYVTGQPPIYEMSPINELMMSQIVSTGEYCIENIPQLEEIMKKHINRKLIDDIDFSAQIDAYMDMVNYTYGIMVAGIMERLEPAFKILRKLNLSAIDYVGDNSQYVKLIIRELNDTIPRIRYGMSSSYFQSCCMKLLTAIFEKVLDILWKMKRMSKAGAGQLLMDVNGLKEYFCVMPNKRLREGEEPIIISKTYNNVVYGKAAKVERVLKLVCTEDAMLVETFQLLWPEGE